jgi:hypothetical protein
VPAIGRRPDVERVERRIDHRVRLAGVAEDADRAHERSPRRARFAEHAIAVPERCQQPRLLDGRRIGM